MKILKIVTGIVFLLLLLQGFGYLNLMVSEKYETQPEGLFDDLTDKIQKKTEKRSIQIQRQKRNVVISALVLLVVFILLCVILVRKSNLNNTGNSIPIENKE